MAALKNTRILKALAYIACGGFTVYTLLLARVLITGSAGGSIWRCAGSVLGILLFAFTSQKLALLERQFIYTDYAHWKV